MTEQFNIDGMGCDHCIDSVKEALTLDGVTINEVKLGFASVESTVPRDKLIQLITAAGYTVTN
ncbi:MAG: heavy-metal-associated domain-containing protein [Spirochaetaceae bacterium]|nr:heavy-metal-associated domain-containing protein [Spirochaetaceae bacterium]